MPLTISENAKPLFEPKRNKVMYGGRGGGKSHDIGSALLTLGAEKKMGILCAREVMKTITQSVHRLLKNKINGEAFLRIFYTITDNKIIGANGTEFHFIGLKHNPDGVKSYEGFDIVWVEEADNVSDRSWEVLIPTIRKEGSEIWVSFNPRYASDPTWQRFVVNADEDSWVKKVGWNDNPWFPDVLDKERRKLERTDPVAYQHIWEGEFDERFTGMVFAKFLKKAKEEGRISCAPYKQGLPVFVAWDLGKSDYTSIWFGQMVGLQPRVIDFYENNQEELPHYADIINDKPYKNMVHYLPHDAEHNRLGMKLSIRRQLMALGLNCKKLKVTSEKARIEMAREMISEMYLDKDKCKDGLHALNNFQYLFDETKQKPKDKPHHDWSSHASDAFGYLAQAFKQKTEPKKPKPKPRKRYSAGDWAG